MFTGTVNFDYRKFEKCAFIEKSPDHFQNLMFTGTVNFDTAHFSNFQVSKFTVPVNIKFRKWAAVL